MYRFVSLVEMTYFEEGAYPSSSVVSSLRDSYLYPITDFWSLHWIMLIFKKKREQILSNLIHLAENFAHSGSVSEKT